MAGILVVPIYLDALILGELTPVVEAFVDSAAFLIQPGKKI